MTRVAVVGYGYWGSKHVRVLSAIPEVQIVVVDANPHRRAAAALEFPRVSTVASLDDALQAVDAVVIATPASTHGPLALQAIEAGADVFVEKPLATSSEEAVQMIERAHANRVLLMVGHTFEYNAAVARLRDVIRRGDLGDLYYIDSARLNLGLYQPDVNVLWDLAPHDVSIANFLLEAEPDEVTAWGRGHARRNTVDVAQIHLRYEALGVSAYIRVSWLHPSKVRSVTVAGSARMALYDDTSTDERLRIFDKGVAGAESEGPEFPLTYRTGDLVSPHIPFDEPLAVEDRHFIDCVRDLAECRTPGASGLSVVRVLEAADRSIVLGRTVHADEAPLPLRVTTFPAA